MKILSLAAIFTPPALPTNEQTRRARLLHRSLLVVLTGGVLIPLILALANPAARWLVNALFATIDLAILGLLVLLQRGHIRPTARLFCGLLWMGFTIPIAAFDGVGNSAVAGYFIVIMLSALILGRPAALGATLLSILALGLAFTAEHAGFLQVHNTPPTPLVDLLFLVALLMITGLLLSAAIKRIDEGYAHFRQKKQLLQTVNQMLENSQQKLQQQVAERTAELEQANRQLRHELHERTQTEATLRDSEARFRVLFEHSPDAIVLIDPHHPTANWPIIDCNPACCRLNGYSRDELVGQSIDILHSIESPPQDRAGYFERLRRAKQMTLEAVHRRKNGELFPVHVSTSLINLAGRELILGIDRDISAIKQTEQVLRESESRYRHLVRHAPAGIFELDLHTYRFSSVNDIMCELTGYSRDQFLALRPFDLLIKESRLTLRQHQRRLKAGQPLPEAAEYRVKAKDGRQFWVLVNTKTVFENNQPVTVLAVVQNISARRQMEQDLRRSQEMYRALSENSTDIIMRFDRQHRHLYVNPAVVSVLPAFTPADFIGKTHLEMGLPLEMCRYWEAMIEKVFETGQIQVDTFELPAENGRTVIYWQLVPEFDGAGTVETVLVTSRDITPQREAEEALQQAHAHLEAKVQARTADLTAANRQLTTLLTASRAVSSTLDINRVEAMIAEQLVEAIGAGGCTLSRWDKQADTIITWHEHRRDDLIIYVRGTPYALNDFPLTRHVLEQRCPVVVQANDPAADPAETAHMRRVQTASLLMVPLVHGNQAIGLAELDYAYPRNFTETEVQLCQALAEHAAVAIQHANLYEQVQQELAERERAEAQLKASLHEKEVLLQEIHHRVKNNLQVINSMLNLQADYVNDPATKEAFRISQSRVRAMALVHEKLYRSRNLARIDMADYLRDLAASLFKTCAANQTAIRFILKADPVFFTIEKAVPCGLILNELIVNSIKHAFPNNQAGEITVNLTAGDKTVVMEVADNGVGLPNGLDFHQADTLGLRLVHALADQLDAAIDLGLDHGTKIMITLEHTHNNNGL